MVFPASTASLIFTESIIDLISAFSTLFRKYSFLFFQDFYCLLSIPYRRQKYNFDFYLRRLFADSVLLFMRHVTKALRALLQYWLIHEQ